MKAEQEHEEAFNIPPPLPVSPRQSQSSVTMNVSPSPSTSSDNEENKNYDREITSLQFSIQADKEKAEILKNAEAYSEAASMLDQVIQKTRLIQCLKNQKGRRVPFYQGKATCVTAVRGDD